MTNDEVRMTKGFPGTGMGVAGGVVGYREAVRVKA